MGLIQEQNFILYSDCLYTTVSCKVCSSSNTSQLSEGSVKLRQSIYASKVTKTNRDLLRPC